MQWYLVSRCFWNLCWASGVCLLLLLPLLTNSIKKTYFQRVHNGILYVCMPQITITISASSPLLLFWIHSSSSWAPPQKQIPCTSTSITLWISSRCSNMRIRQRVNKQHLPFFPRTYVWYFISYIMIPWLIVKYCNVWMYINYAHRLLVCKFHHHLVTRIVSSFLCIG